MSKYDSIRKSLDVNGLAVEVSDDLFEDFMALQLRFKAAGCRIQFEYGRPSAGLMDGSAKVFSMGKDKEKLGELIRLLLELLDLFEREVEEDSLQAVFADDIAQYREALSKILEVYQVANEEQTAEAIEAAKVIKFEIQKS